MLKNKGVIIGIAAAAAVSVGGVGVFAAGNIARSNSIGEDAARRAAYADAGVNADEVLFEKTEFEFERGKYVYDVEFVTIDTEYDYTLDAGTGQIIEKDYESRVKQVPQTETPDPTAAPTETPAAAPEQPAESETASAIGIDAAKRIALQDAGVSAADVVFTSAKQDQEKTGLIYDIEFFIRGVSEYEYEIDAYTGDIVDKNVEAWEAEDDADRTDPAAEDTTKPEKPQRDRDDYDDTDDTDDYDDPDDANDADDADDANDADDDDDTDDADDADDYDDDADDADDYDDDDETAAPVYAPEESGSESAAGYSDTDDEDDDDAEDESDDDESDDEED